MASVQLTQVVEKMKLDGETTWRIALDALKSILWDLNWQC